MYHREHHGNGYSANTSTAGSSSASVNGRLAPVGKEATNVSRLSSEEESVGEGAQGGEEGEVVCRGCNGCKGKRFRVRIAGGVGRSQVLECVDCGEAV